MIGPHPRVLVVEDDPSIAALVPRALQRLGGDCQAVATAEAALDLLTGQPWDLLITDLSLPGKDGLTLLREVRQLRVDLPVIVLTGDVRSITTAQAIEGGATEVLAKPFQVAALRELVARLTGTPDPAPS